MSQIKTLNGVQYTLPQYNDTGWGANTGNVLTQYMAAIADVTLQLSGGSFTLTADVNFGATYGLVSAYFTSRTTTPATAGAVRLAKTDVVSWRNNAGGGNIDLSKDTSDNLKWNATKILLSGAVVNADINASAAIAYSKLALTGSIVNADIGASAAIAYSKLALTGAILNADLAGSIAYSKLVLTGSIVNADMTAGTLTNTAINSAAAIALSKLAALGTAKAVQTNASTGFLEASSVTNTELGYLSGVSSAIQAQINALSSHVFQIVTGTQSGASTTASTVFVTTGTTVTITPSSSSHKILIIASGCLATARNDHAVFATLARDGTNLGGTDGIVSLQTGLASGSAFSDSKPAAMVWLDSPASTSPIVYAVYFRSDSGSFTQTWGEGSSKQSIVAIEVV